MELLGIIAGIFVCLFAFKKMVKMGGTELSYAYTIPDDFTFRFSGSGFAFALNTVESKIFIYSKNKTKIYSKDEIRHFSASSYYDHNYRKYTRIFLRVRDIDNPEYEYNFKGDKLAIKLEEVIKQFNEGTLSPEIKSVS